MVWYSTPNTATFDALFVLYYQVLFSFFSEHPKQKDLKKMGCFFFLPSRHFSTRVVRNAQYTLYTKNVLRRVNHGWSSLVVLRLRGEHRPHQRFRMECVLVFLSRLLPQGVRPPRPPAIFPEKG